MKGKILIIIDPAGISQDTVKKRKGDIDQSMYFSDGSTGLLLA